jgi:hypothetical protein
LRVSIVPLWRMPVETCYSEWTDGVRKCERESVRCRRSIECGIERLRGVRLVAARTQGRGSRRAKGLVGEEFVIAFGGGDGVGRGVIGSGHNE